MKFHAALLLIAFLVSLASPLVFSPADAYGKDSSFWTLDVCNKGQVGLSSGGHSVILHENPIDLITFTSAISFLSFTPRMTSSLLVFQDVKPPEA